MDLSWLTIIKREVKTNLKAVDEEISLGLRIAQESDGPSQYIEAIETDLANLQQAYAYLDTWDDLQAFMAASKFVRLSGKKSECDEVKKEKVKDLRDSYKKRWNDMKDQWFTRNLTG